MPSLKQGSACLAHHDDGTADLQSIADVQVGFEDAFGCEVLAEHSPGKIHAGEFSAPEGIVFGGIGVDRFERASVDVQVGLAVKIECAQLDWALDRLFEDSCAHGSSVVEDEPGPRDVERKQFH